ncbi:MAG TPA: sigma 54-interacting transcriptional regulator [bacterium]|jgi:transcriptional regulator with GAF, ATPase, and Fis domain
MDETLAKFEKALKTVERMIEDKKIPLTKLSEPQLQTLIESGKQLLSSGAMPGITIPEEKPAKKAVHGDSGHYEALYGIALAVTGSTDPSLITETVLDKSIKYLKCERGMVVEVDPEGAMAIRISNGVDNDEAADISSTLVTRAVDAGHGILYDSTRDQGSESLVSRKVTLGILAPFKLDGGSHGVLYVDTRDVKTKLGPEHISFLEHVADLAGAAISSAIRINRELVEGRSGGFRGVIGSSEPMRKLCERARRVARTDETVLLLGESGTGKEVFARAIHEESKRAAGPFEAINCSAIPDELLESELFGYVEGAFTGAKKEGKPGIFELADGGTIFLDEIGDMPALLQAKLLRVLQELTIRRVGGTEDISIDVRVIAATNQDLDSKMEDKSFREDLYYRLATFPLSLPPLRDRGNDILELTEFFLEKFSSKLNIQKPSLSPKATFFFLEYPWKGNIREMENLIKRILIDHEPKVIHPKHLPEEMQDAQESAVSDFPTLEELDHAHVLKALNLTKGNRGKAAELLAISEATLYRWINDMKKKGIIEE